LEHEAVLERGRERLTSLLEEPIPRDGVDPMKRRIAQVEAYRVALNTLEIDSLIKRGFVGSSASRQSLEKAVELLQPPEVRAVTSSQPSLAVLPFADLSPLGDQEHFSQGLADQLITGFGKIQGLKVIARGLAFSVAEQDLGVREIGRRLGVDAVLEGSVQRSGDQLSVTAQLVEIAHGHELWSGHFDESVDQVFGIENELIRGVVKALEIRPSSEERRAIEKSPTRIVGAYEFYLRGRRYFAQYHGRGVEFALEMFTRAIELDGEYALAYAGVADCCAFLYSNSGRSPKHREQALEASARALELDPELAEAHLSRGVALSQAGKPDLAGPFFETALRLNPKLFEAHYFYARHHFTNGEPEKAIEFYESASELRPEDYQVPLLSAQIYDDVGRAEDGLEVRRRGVEVAEEHIKLNPDDARALYIGANGLVSLGQIEKGLQWARLARELQPNEPMALYNLACIYSLAGETDEAIDCFAASIENGFSYRDWAEHDSNLDSIREDPRFLALIDRL
jgi:TolB-like protein/Flp pilus assembly protein TadD